MATLLNTVTTLSCKSKTTETENTLHEKSDCQETFNKLGIVNHCTDNLIGSNTIDHQLPSVDNSIDFLIMSENRNSNVTSFKSIYLDHISGFSPIFN